MNELKMVKKFVVRFLRLSVPISGPVLADENKNLLRSQLPIKFTARLQELCLLLGAKRNINYET